MLEVEVEPSISASIYSLAHKLSLLSYFYQLRNKSHSSISLSKKNPISSHLSHFFSYSEKTLPKSMDKTLTVKAKKQPKNKKKQLPLKVVYITNPVKFNATASEFRALVQELTGQDADFSRFAAAGQEEVKVAAAAQEGINYVDAAAQKGSDLSTTSGSYEDDGCCSPEMIDNFQGLAASSLWHGDINEVRVDVFKSLGAM